METSLDSSNDPASLVRFVLIILVSYAVRAAFSEELIKTLLLIADKLLERKSSLGILEDVEEE